MLKIIISLGLIEVFTGRKKTICEYIYYQIIWYGFVYFFIRV